MSSPGAGLSATDRAAFLIGTWFGCGYFPKGPGTVGSLAAVAIAWTGVPVGVAALLLLGPAVWASGRVAQRLGGKDPQIVVVDEVVGQWIALASVPLSPAALALGFLLFRFFDIVKPWPVRRFETLPGGWGVMMDDVAAGALGAIVLLAVRWLNLIP